MIPRTKHLRTLMIGAMMSAGLVTVTLAPRVALAQTSKGTLTGVVRDGSGAVVVGAKVTAIDSSNGEIRITATTTLGAYRLDALTPGQYTLHVESTGFEQFEQRT